jgi:hypothetical protein
MDGMDSIGIPGNISECFRMWSPSQELATVALDDD